MRVLKIRRKIELPHINAIEVEGLPDLENDPFFIKMHQEAEAFILKNGLPKGLEKEYEIIKKNAKSPR